MANEIENEDSLNLDEDTEVEAPEEETPEEKADRLEGLNKKLFARAKKAEGFEEVDGKWVKKPKPVVETKPVVQTKEADLSTEDVYAAIQANVPKEDLKDVREAAKVLKLSFSDALEHQVVKTILERKASLRKTAEATNTSTARPGSKKVTDESLLEEASKGNLPEKGSKEAEQLFWARRGGKK